MKLYIDTHYCAPGCCSLRTDEDRREVAYDVGALDANDIVRAVNSHDDLLKACEAALEVMLYKGRLAFAGSHVAAGEWTAATESAVAKLEAAIAKAHDGR